MTKPFAHARVQALNTCEEHRIPRTAASSQHVYRTLLAAVILILLLPPAQAHAVNRKFVEYGQTAGLCSDTNKGQWHFDGSEWNSTLKARFVAGFESWSQDVERWSGGYLVTNGGQDWSARWDDLGSASTHARTVCILGLNNIEFNTERLGDYQDNSLSLHAVAAHEWGHAFGLGHVGTLDVPSGNGGPPTMATCTSASSRASLSSDDEAAITSQNESVDGIFDTATANSSFEENEASHIGWWKPQSLGEFFASSSGGGVDGSPWYAIMKGNGASNAAAYSDTYVTADNGLIGKARANYKKYSSGDYGSVKVTYKHQAYNHSGSSCGKLNGLTSISGWYATSKVCYPTSTWNYCTTSQLSYGGANYRVIRARVVLYNRMKWTIDGVELPQRVRFDRTRILIDD
ncbi:MAG: matrixin family metalloprotease [Nitriliruptorales bacterium]|nr:matrixin family metalloprotease [Nitriliruptorales bacterium]